MKLFKGILYLLLLTAVSKHSVAQHRVEASVQKMGTTFRIVSFVEDSISWNAVIERCWEKLDEVDRTFSNYRADSEASKIVQRFDSDYWIPISQSMWEVVQFSLNLSEASSGAFDITIGPLSKLWRRAFRRDQFPNTTSINEAVKLVDYRQIEINHHAPQLQIRQEGMQLDFGGIAKGFAVDEVFKILRDGGYSVSLVDGGGDIYAGDPPPEQKGWSVRVSNPDSVIIIANKAIATSGDTFQHLEWEGKRYSHIIHPRTGLGIETPNVLTVLSDRCMEADALASVALITTQGQLAEILERFPRSEIWGFQ